MQKQIHHVENREGVRSCAIAHGLDSLRLIAVKGRGLGHAGMQGTGPFCSQRALMPYTDDECTMGASGVERGPG